MKKNKPWILFDNIITKEKEKIVTMKFISHSDYFLTGHFENYSVYPGVLLLEGIKQSAMEMECLMGYELQKIQARFLQPVLPGIIVTYDINLIRENELIELKAEGMSEDLTPFIKCKLTFRRSRSA
ncbi:hypothetical protein [Bacillus sp. 166amftsu]|uniref:hypothetical protein n=1 Tax=Bacillus sp. 166amftsu TaxID=1761753 RepID=UPI0008973F73|nr:hypothetical protein [Bacillus sp. 166amftsu]SDZ37827.1 3-hydroxyacyl-[acyl-carrier-protein] dehydratase [Bacillus sp. 166amftsu]